MKLDIEPDDQQPIRPHSVVPPPDFTSRAVRLRLMMLFAMLVGVLLLMKEAGKPERWQWMGFDDPAATQSGDDKQPVNAKSRPAENSESVESSFDQSPSQATSAAELPGSKRADERQSDSTDSIPVNGGVNYPVAAQKFWATTIEKMNAAQRRELFRFMKAIRIDRSVTESARTEFQKLVELVAKRRARFHREMFDQLALIPAGSEEKTKLANEHFESQEIWEKKILPTFQAVLRGEDFTVSQLQQINRLQQVLDPLAFAAVQDRTTIGWEGDSTAWVRMWERVSDGDFGQPLDATHLQLSSQPGFYRGRAVNIAGWVRSARRENLTNSELGVDHYFILWVRPADTNLAPYCLYSLDLPDGFPELTEQFRDLNKRIKVTGLFFKIRTYVDAASKVNECPVILAQDFTLDPEVIPLAVNAWQPSRATLITLLMLIPLVATAIAWLVYQSSQPKRYQPGKTMTKKIQHTLQELTHDPSVQSDMEKIKELYQADAEEN